MGMPLNFNVATLQRDIDRPARNTDSTPRAWRWRELRRWWKTLAIRWRATRDEPDSIHQSFDHGFSSTDKFTFVDGFLAGFDASRQGFNRETAELAHAPEPEHLVANPTPQAAVDGLVRYLAARALVIWMCRHTAAEGRCTKCQAEGGGKATRDPRRKV